MMNEVEIGDMVKIKKEYGGGRGEVEDKRGSFITVKGKSYHESDVEVIKADYVDTAYERTVSSDVKYRFVIDATTI